MERSNHSLVLADKKKLRWRKPLKDRGRKVPWKDILKNEGNKKNAMKPRDRTHLKGEGSSEKRRRLR